MVFSLIFGVLSLVGLVLGNVLFGFTLQGFNINLDSVTTAIQDLLNQGLGS